MVITTVRTPERSSDEEVFRPRTIPLFVNLSLPLPPRQRWPVDRFVAGLGPGMAGNLSSPMGRRVEEAWRDGDFRSPQHRNHCIQPQTLSARGR